MQIELRDLFAAAALAGSFANPATMSDESMERLGEMTYGIADHVLKGRGEQEDLRTEIMELVRLLKKVEKKPYVMIESEDFWLEVSAKLANYEGMDDE